MIKLPDASNQSRAERFALDVLVDLARLVPAGPTLDVVRLELSEQAPRDLRGWMAAGWGIDVADGVVRVPRAVLQLVIEVAGAASEAYSPISGDITVQRVLFADAELTPIASIDALIDAVLHAVEVVDSPDEIELIVDAISRLAGQPPADFDQRVAPLLHRPQHGRTAYKGLGASEVGVVPAHGLTLVAVAYPADPAEYAVRAERTRRRRDASATG